MEVNRGRPSATPVGPTLSNRIVVTENTTYISNPGFPTYENNILVEWLLESAANTRIRLQFLT